jgi:hypothetical protein
LELFIHSMENYDLPGCSHKRENPRGVEKLWMPKDILEKVQIFVFLVSKWNVESVYKNNICLWMYTLLNKQWLSITNKTDLCSRIFVNWRGPVLFIAEFKIL